MAYTEKEARALIIEAGHTLTEKKLIARTWGNISAKISDTEFIITPSGRTYEDLRPEDLVKVNFKDLTWEGEIKPSSEKGAHAVAYSLRPDVNFVIHTHQLYASAVAAAEKDTEFAPCATYGLPGTKKLTAAIAKAVSQNPEKKMFLLAKHGVLCFGESMEDAFTLCDALEEQCKATFDARISPWEVRSCPKAYLDDYAQIVGPGKRNTGSVKTDDPEAVAMITKKNAMAAAYAQHFARSMALSDALLQRSVYLLKYSKLKSK